jgi:hypothetical protein
MNFHPAFIVCIFVIAATIAIPDANAGISCTRGRANKELHADMLASTTLHYAKSRFKLDIQKCTVRTKKGSQLMTLTLSDGAQLRWEVTAGSSTELLILGKPLTTAQAQQTLANLFAMNNDKADDANWDRAPGDQKLPVFEAAQDDPSVFGVKGPNGCSAFKVGTSGVTRFASFGVDGEGGPVVWDDSWDK